MRLVMAGFILNLLFFSYGIAFEGLPIDSSSPIVKTILKSREARENRDFKSTWELTDMFTKKERFNNNFEEFVNFVVDVRSKYSPIKSQLTKVIMITSNRAWVEATNLDNPDFKGLYLVKEQEEWKIAFLDVYLKKTRGDLENLKKVILQYLEDNKKLPDTLSQLVPDYIENIPLDPFNDKGGSYIYSPGKGVYALYSFGPDSDDDSGLADYNFKNGPISDGDIITKGSVE